MWRMSVIDEMFKDLFGTSFDRYFSTSSSVVGTSVRKDGDKTVIEVEMPGAKREDVDLSLADSILTVSWKCRGTEKVREFRVSRDLDASRIKAKVEHGLLTVELHREEQKAPKAAKIPVG